MAVADKQRILHTHVQNLKLGQRFQLTFPQNKAGAGRKGNKQRRYGERRGPKDPSANSNASSSQPSSASIPFTEIWHNNYPLVIAKISSLPRGSFCTQCGIDFPLFHEEPHDIAITHEERWKWVDKESGVSPRYRPSAKTTTKYYCVNKNCIMVRFPYFRVEFLDTKSVDIDIRCNSLN